MPWQRVSEMAGKFKVHHVGHLSGPIFTAYISEGAQHPCPSPWTPHVGHSESIAFQPVPFQIAPGTPSTKTGHENLDTQPVITAGGSGTAVAPFLYGCTSAFDNP